MTPWQVAKAIVAILNEHWLEEEGVWLSAHCSERTIVLNLDPASLANPAGIKPSTYRFVVEGPLE